MEACAMESKLSYETQSKRKNHASSSTDFEQQPKTVRGDENTRSEEINQYHAIIGYVCEGKLQGLKRSNEARKTKMLENQKGRKKDEIKGNNIRDGSSTKISSREDSKYRAFSDDPSSLVSSGPFRRSTLATGAFRPSSTASGWQLPSTATCGLEWLDELLYSLTCSSFLLLKLVSTPSLEMVSTFSSELVSTASAELLSTLSAFHQS